MTVWLVTGGAGFIGSHFISQILNVHPSDSVFNFDLLTYAGNLDNLTSIQDNPNYHFVRGDIRNQHEVDSVMKHGIDYVVNFAAETHVDRSIADAGLFVQTNVYGTQVLLESARKHRVRKFVQVSTDEVYGSLGKTGTFYESTLLAPSSPYSASKAAADLMVQSYQHTYGLPVNITRCTNNYGPYQFPEKLIPLTIARAMAHKKIPVYGDGRQIRDWLHVSDHCKAIEWVAHDGRAGEVYNIGGENERENIAIVRAILRHLNKPESLIEHVSDRPGHDRRYAMDSGKLRRESGWRPAYPFDIGLEETIRWYVEHPKWWQRLLGQETPQSAAGMDGGDDS